MESKPTLGPVAELRYAFGSQNEDGGFIQTIAKWCIILGAIAAAEFIVQLVAFSFQRGFVIWTSPSRWFVSIAMGLEILRLPAAVAVILCGVGVVRRRSQIASRLVLALGALLTVEGLIGAIRLAALVRYWVPSRTSESALQLSYSFISLMTTCLPTAILLSVTRRDFFRDEVEQM